MMGQVQEKKEVVCLEHFGLLPVGLSITCFFWGVPDRTTAFIYVLRVGQRTTRK